MIGFRCAYLDVRCTAASAHQDVLPVQMYSNRRVMMVAEEAGYINTH